ncbi:hypothetical protein NQ315_000255 [Exocentrus adspersus]|uniref:Max-binding protein MNT n=1 Tax=Exocentrus adspersus TaxID=1586481 RepID=A0AAV8VRW3_9CUCU|nr:hypothetical protein NQ315_000255 [Exocentrus adspersus]
MSSLSTLLEAAKFLELQEQQQQQHRATVEAALATMAPIPSTAMAPVNTAQPQVVTASHGPTKPITTSPQTVVISSNNISSTILQGPISFPPQTQMVKKLEQDGQVTSTTVPQVPRHRILHNSFDIMNPPDNRRNERRGHQEEAAAAAGTREVHNKLEKHRRAHLKECFDILKKQLPATQDEKKTSNLSILHSALRYIQTLKRKERELEHEMERLAREKISAQQRLAVLKKEISSHYDNVDFSKLLPEIVPNGNSPSHSVPEPMIAVINPKSEPVTTSSCSNGGSDKVAIPILAKTSIPVVTQSIAPAKEVAQPVQTTALSVLPMTYPVNQGLVLQKVAIVPKGLDGLTPLVSTHFITAPQQINGKVVPLTQYLVKPVVVVSTASPRPS